MASIDLGAEFNESGNDIREVSSNVSKPTKRQRWATQRRAGAGGTRKRVSIVDRLHKKNLDAKEEMPKTSTSNSPTSMKSPTSQQTTTSTESPTGSGNRRIYFNIPIPESERDEDGRPKAAYPRNKIRTAKYTALSFVPKNIWFQFQNIANIYFLFIIILSV